MFDDEDEGFDPRLLVALLFGALLGVCMVAWRSAEKTPPAESKPTPPAAAAAAAGEGDGSGAA